MEHIKQYDWLTSDPDTCFITEEALDNSVTERILRNQFRDPLLSSDEEDESQKPHFNWDEIFKKGREFEAQRKREYRVYVPGLRPLPPYPKLSVMSMQRHIQCLKVLCSENPTILSKEFLPRPTKQDRKVFDELQEMYLKEQQEFKEWAKTLWATFHCAKALRPKPTVETVYDAEFKVRANQLRSFPKTYKLAAQIPLEMTNNDCEMIFEKDLKKINVADLPQSNFQNLTEKLVTIIRPSSVPEPCNKHPSRFILPNENSMSILPLTEVHRELSQWALEAGATFVASENSLKCLVETERAWMLPVSVCEAFTEDGDRRNVVVLGSDFTTHREPPMVRTYKAFRHLLEYTLIPPEERARIEMKRHNQELNEKGKLDVASSSGHSKPSAGTQPQPHTSRNDRMSIDRLSTSSDEDGLFIDIAANDSDKPASDTETVDAQMECLDLNQSTAVGDPGPDNTGKDKSADEIGFYNCTCKDTEFEVPPPRSFRKWLVRNQTARDEQTIIVHCSHKMKSQTAELIVEPIPEYQIDLAGSQQSPGRLASLALSLALRKNASVLNVRVDSSTGDIVTVEHLFPDEFNAKNAVMPGLAANRIHCTLNQLEGLMPGHYVLQHDPSHGSNALLYAPAPPEISQLTLHFDSSQLAETDEAKSVKTPPVLAPVLLPYHKFRKILPLAFTPFERQVAKEPKKPPARQKTPPQAIKYPKKKRQRKKK